MKTCNFDMGVCDQAHYCHKCSIADNSYLHTIIKCSAIELVSWQVSQAHASDFYSDCLVQLGVELTRLIVWKIAWVPFSLCMVDASSFPCACFRSSDHWYMLGRSSAFLLIVVLGQLFPQMLHPRTQDVKQKNRVQYDLQVPWDPDKLAWFRLEGKPNFMEGGLSAYLYPIVGPDHGLLLNLGLLSSCCYKYGRRCHEQVGLDRNGRLRPG